MNLGLQTVSDDHYVNHQFILSVAINSVVIKFVLSVESWHLAVQWVMSLVVSVYRNDQEEDYHDVDDDDSYDDDLKDRDDDDVKDDESNDILSSCIYGSSPSRYDEVVPHKTNHSVLKRKKQ